MSKSSSLGQLIVHVVGGGTNAGPYRKKKKLTPASKAVERRAWTTAPEKQQVSVTKKGRSATGGLAQLRSCKNLFAGKSRNAWSKKPFVGEEGADARKFIGGRDPRTNQGPFGGTSGPSEQGPKAKTPFMPKEEETCTTFPFRSDLGRSELRLSVEKDPLNGKVASLTDIQKSGGDGTGGVPLNKWPQPEEKLLRICFKEQSWSS